MTENINDSQRNIKLVRCKCNAWTYPNQVNCKWCNKLAEQKAKDNQLLV